MTDTNVIFHSNFLNKAIDDAFKNDSIYESRFCPRGQIMLGKLGFVIHPTDVLLIRFNGRFPFECRYSLGERERRREQRKKRRNK